MASSFQQQALHRKLIYVLLIVGLFTGSLLFRSYVLEPRAGDLALREQNVGTVDLSGYALRLSLTGMRGVATSILWWNAKERQKKNQWDELEILVNSITKLQPHFITPWLFQSWNLSYNVAVQCDRPRDKYFYIARGIQLLAEGERQNQYQPELRFAMGTYYHQKITNADHKIPLQTLFEMSGIDPVHRDPKWLQEEDRDHRPRYERFLCEQNPRLVRRLREKLGCTTLKQVFEYLEENKKIPTLFGDRLEGEGDDLKTRYKLNREKPFPVLPPTPEQPYDPMGSQPLDQIDQAGSVFDALAAARTWYQYAQLPLPPPDPTFPMMSQPIEDPIRQRHPVHMTTLIFRDYPALAQSYLGDRVEEEGWFDDSGWRIPGWFPGDKFSNGEPALVGVGRNWGVETWGLSHQMWTDFGSANHLLKTPEDEAQLVKEAEPLYKKHELAVGGSPPPLQGRDRNNPVMQRAYHAAQILYGYGRGSMLTNFKHQSARAEVESKPQTVAVRKALYEAEQLRLAGRAAALAKYESALKDWAKIMADNPEYCTQSTSEDSYELEWNYLQLFQATPAAPLLKQELFAEVFLASAALPGPDLGCLDAARLSRPHAVAMPVVVGPLDGRAMNGEPILQGAAVSAVLTRKRVMAMPPMPITRQLPPGRGVPGVEASLGGAAQPPGAAPPRMPPPIGSPPK